MPDLQDWSTLQASAHWRTVDCISDLHLHPAEPATFTAWARYLRHTPAQAVFILGDLFEVWVGDDVVQQDGPDTASTSSFETRCAAVLRDASARRSLYFMAGNRDFLLGEDFAQRCGMQLLHDPTVLVFGDRRWLLSHGDALCLDDKDYMQFRAQVRARAWQANFLAQPLAERQAIARNLRAQSEARKRTQPHYVDLDPAATHQWLLHAAADTFIHGHTHRPADHALAGGGTRRVLSDWDLDATPPRAEVLRLEKDQDGSAVQVRRVPVPSP